MLKLCHHVDVYGVVVGCNHHECMLIMHLLCMSVSTCFYACIFMVKVFVHDVIVVILGHHDVVDML